MKKLTLTICLLAILTGSFAADVSEKVLKEFANAYPGAKSVTWEEMKEGYKVYFVKKDASYRIMYDADGNITLALKYYGEDNLPPLILNKVKKNYAGYKIHSVVEESSDVSLSYHIVLENEKKILNVKSDAVGTLETESKYNKG